MKEAQQGASSLQVMLDRALQKLKEKERRREEKEEEETQLRNESEDRLARVLNERNSLFHEKQELLKKLQV